MPIFEYTCHDCHAEFELLVRSDTRLQCPSCQSAQLDKKLSVFATTASGGGQADASQAFGPCGSCGHPDGPGSCRMQ
ncbi:MAG: zinc ribbon domain-containing protein [Burkholderiales bacterium]|nr:zinc ribbon domain-containing protein [Burkholderiales bacterium]